MAIYTRFGTRVTFATAREVPVWIEQSRAEVKWHYAEPKRTKKTTSIECIQIWHVTARSDDDRAGHGEVGRMICDGRELPDNEFRADDGIREIYAECRRVREAAGAMERQPANLSS